ncbi:transcription termination factor 4, mitochondrial-like [Physella acuta]|uniref:transcription termination factor 4, mitochondrial-like n=1 Tax=Physella acuta TaxID=109671 RepID=UPI0027DD0728|nr:transcription termination factor 4, mitochondrial-like [Physella acuta]XP_059141666.1 transcription termination factor 4, mitochondrial-like [Physella acuta]
MSLVNLFNLYRKDLKLVQTIWKSLCQVHILCQNQTEHFNKCCLVVKNSYQFTHSTENTETAFMSRVVGSCKLYTSCRILANSVPHFNSLAKAVVESASMNDVMASSVPLDKVSELLSDLYKLGFSIDSFAKLLSQNVSLLRQSSSLLEMTKYLRSYGLQHNTIIVLLEKLSRHFSFDKKNMEEFSKKITYSMENFRNMGFSEKDLLSLVNNDPEVVFVDAKVACDIYSKLKRIFTSEKVISVIKKCPNVLLDPWSETLQKFEYAYYNMYYDMPEIVKSRLFSHSLEHITDRHIYLVRTGLFVPFKKKLDPNLNPNPHLKDIVDVSNHAFASTFAGLSKEEYKVYLEIRALEREEENQENNDSSSSDEE